MIQITNEDNMELMARYPDNYFDLAIVDPPYGIACHDYGFDLTCCELDKEYFDKAMERINNHMAQTKLF